MKGSQAVRWAACVLVAAFSFNHSEAQSGRYVIGERGLNHRVWNKVAAQTNADGQVMLVTNRAYVELGSGLYFRDVQGQLRESSDQIEILPAGGAAAVQGQHKVYFPSDIHEGVIELVTPDGRHLKSRPLGISYYDGTNNVLIGRLTNSVGLLLPSGNQVIYTNAFEGCAADLLVTCRRSGLEADVVFREAPTLPGNFPGLNVGSARLQLWTEFFDTSDPESEAATTGPQDGLTDSTLKFGVMRMTRGKAFAVAGRGANGGSSNPVMRARAGSEPVYKRWQRVGGRTFLIEELPYWRIRAELDRLGTPGGPANRTAAVDPILNKVSPIPMLPPLRPVPAKTSAAIQLAGADISSQPGYVLDYVLVSSHTNAFTFQGDTTYYVNGELNFSGGVIIEGGTVIKFNPTNAGYIFVDGGTVSCQTSPYRPAIFTSKHDNSVGETIAGSTGNPDVNEDQNYYFAAMNVDPLDLHDLRLAYCYCGISPINGHATLRNIQFVHAAYPLWIVTTAGCRVQNTLMYDVQYAFDVVQSAVAVEHLTVDQCQQLGLNDFQATLALTNCLLAGVQGLGNIPLTTNVVFLTGSNETVFQTVGAGRHYLASNSPYRDTGTTNINPDLLADLRTKTTCPPTVYTNLTFTTDTTLSPQAQRDTDAPDLGYHYQPLDYLVACTFSNASLTLTNGVAVAYLDGAALAFQAGGQFVSRGTAEARNYLVHYGLVQEQPVTLGAGEANIFGDAGCQTPVDLNFTTLAFPAGHGASHLGFYLESMSLRNCEIFGSGINADIGCGTQLDWENNLFRDVCFTEVSGSGQFVIRNNSFVAPLGAEEYFAAFWSGTGWTILDNVFDGYWDESSGGTRHNAYVNGASGDIQANDIVITNFTWQAGPLGNYYQPANSALHNAGSINADLLGFYHYTTTTNQVKETNSVVDIGYHYVATDVCGNPLDADNDSVPDYLEDANGNGVYDGGDPWDWQTADADTDGDNLPDWWELKYFGNLSQPWDGDYDSDGTNNLDEFYAGTDPNTIWFDAHFESLFVNQQTVAGVCNVHGGVPAQMALLVNNTNLAAAAWTAYASNFTATLGATDGVYLVRVALRGLTTNFPPVWDDTTITLDRVPPALVITNPVSLPATVGRPYLQLLGCADEPLAGVEYDITNAAGVLTNELGFVVDQVFDTNCSSFTTNYFQCYDVALTNGLNTIILRATDLAGNVVTTNLAVTLDYNNVTNPPALQLTWPAAGVQLSGDRFTVRGQLDDETAQITALVVDVNANTNVVEGLVERNGAFWIEDVPLTAGESSLTLTARNAAGLETNLTLTLTRSDVELTIDPVPPDVSLYDGKTTVSGTISVADYSISVNGVPATAIWPSGNGWGWYAENVPVVGRGTATFDVVATPPESANPPPPVAAAAEVEMPACIRIVEHRLIKSASDTSNDGYVNSSTRVKTYTAQYRADPSGYWIPAYDGTATDLFSDSRTQYSGEYDYVWSQSGASTHYSDGDGVDYSINSIYEPHREVTGLPDEDLREVGTPPSWIYHYYASGVNYSWSHPDGSYSDAAVMARTVMKLFTGGKAGVGRRNLFCIDALADQYGKPSESGWLHTPVIPIPNDRVRALGRWFGADGKLWVTLPDNASPDLLLSAPARHYDAWALATKYKATITASSSTTNANLDVDVPEFCVGQHVTFTLDGLPLDEVSNMVGRWNLPDKFVNEKWQLQRTVIVDPDTGAGYVEAYGSENYRINSSLLENTNQTSCWYVNSPGGRISVGMSLKFNNGQCATVAAKGEMQILRPEVSKKLNSFANGQWYSDCNATIDLEGGSFSLQLTDDAMEFWTKVKSPCPGFLDYVQLISGSVGSDLVGDLSTGSDAADTSVPYSDGVGIGQSYWAVSPRHRDGPSTPGGISSVYADYSFNVYLRFKPDGDTNNIQVTLARISWYWMAGAWVSNGFIEGNSDCPPPVLNESDDFPFWTHIYSLPF